jgi:hypothetical protein
LILFLIYTIKSLYYSDFCISLRISRFFGGAKQTFYFTPKTPYKLTLTPANLRLAYYFYTTQYYLESFTKTLQFHPQIQPLYAKQLLSFAIRLLRLFKQILLSSSLRFHRILLDYFVFSYTSLSGTTTKTHFAPDFTKETPEKSRIDTLLRARALLLYDLLSSLLIRQNKTHLTLFHSLLVHL